MPLYIIPGPKITSTEKTPMKPEVIIRGDISKVLLGFEPSGVIHLGHYINLYTIVNYIEKFKLQGIILISDVHARFNKKTNITEKTKKTVSFFKKFLPQCQIRVSSTFMYEPQYTKKFMELSAQLKVRDLYRALPLERKTDPSKITTLPFNYFLYSVYQCIDGEYLKADLIVAGVDQRNIYMETYNHYQKLKWKKPSFHFNPLLTFSGPGELKKVSEKMSSSGKNIPLDHKLYKIVKSYLITETSNKVIEQIRSTGIHNILEFDSFQSFLVHLVKDLQKVHTFSWDQVQF
jgi:tyrosyl-tRNA synthetase